MTALRRAAAAVLPAGVLLAGCASPAPRGAAADAAALAAPRVETLREAIAVPADVAILRVSNPHGELRVRIGEPGEAGIVATVQRFGDAGPLPLFAHARKGDEVGIEVRYPFAPPPVDPQTGRADHTRGRADLALFVPPDVALDLATSDGRIQVRRARGDVTARSESGIIDVSAGGALRLSSGSGRIVARQESGRWAGESTIEAGTGAVLLALPPGGDIALAIEARGPVTADPGIRLATQAGADGVTRAQRRSGDGRHRLRVAAEGGVHLVPVLGAPDPG